MKSASQKQKEILVMSNGIIYFRYWASYDAKNNSNFCLESYRKAERDSLMYQSMNLNTKYRALKKSIVDFIKN